MLVVVVLQQLEIITLKTIEILVCYTNILMQFFVTKKLAMDQKKRRLIQPASILLPVDSTLDFG